MSGPSRQCEQAGWDIKMSAEGKCSHGPPCPTPCALPPDVDECAGDAHLCQKGQRCVNLLGSYNCLPSCRPGFRVAADGGDCEGDWGTRRGPAILPRDQRASLGLRASRALLAEAQSWVLSFCFNLCPLVFDDVREISQRQQECHFPPRLPPHRGPD